MIENGQILRRIQEKQSREMGLRVEGEDRGTVWDDSGLDWTDRNKGDEK